MKIKDRKYTTKSAIEALEHLIDTFDGKFSNDIEDVESNYFYAVVKVDNDLCISDFNYRSWENVDAIWVIKNGVLEFQSITDSENNCGYEPTPWTYRELMVSHFKKIDFYQCMVQLESVIKKYNELSEKKDAEIERFLSICTEFNK